MEPGVHPSVPPSAVPIPPPTAVPMMPSRAPTAQPTIVAPSPSVIGYPSASPPPRVVHELPSHAPPHPPVPVETQLSAPIYVADEAAEQERQDRFEALATEMGETIDGLQDSEEKREQNYRANEDERERMFVENERRRDLEAQERREGVWRELEDRLAALPPVGQPPLLSPRSVGDGELPTPEVFADAQTLAPSHAQDPDVASVMVETVERAASLHAKELRDIVDLERDELRRERETAQAERERAQAEMEAERARMHDEYHAHIRSLEDELNTVRKELEDEKLARATDEAERRERERAEMLEHNDLIRNQLGDLTNIVSEQRDELAHKRQLMDQRWETKQNRWDQKDEEDAQTRNMLQQILENQSAMLAEQAQCKQELTEQLRASKSF